MENDWEVVFTTQTTFEAELVHGMLLENGIENVILNQRDSAYNAFGEIYVYVRKENLIKANELINH